MPTTTPTFSVSTKLAAGAAITLSSPGYPPRTGRVLQPTRSSPAETTLACIEPLRFLFADRAPAKLLIVVAEERCHRTVVRVEDCRSGYGHRFEAARPDSKFGHT